FFFFLHSLTTPALYTLSLHDALPIFDVARDDELRSRFRFSSCSIFASGKQFTTSSLVSQPLRAAPMPNHKSCKRAVRWASGLMTDRKSTRLNSSHLGISYAVFCLKKK